MTKRRLTQRQQALQAKIQETRIARATKRHKKLEEKLNQEALGQEQPGLLIAHYGANLVIESEDGTLHRCTQRQNLPKLVTGDKVVWRAFQDGSGVVVAQIPRSSELGRPDRQGNIKPMAANVDQIIIILAPSPAPLDTTLDRYLVAAHWLNIEPIIVLNKTDLLPDFPPAATITRLAAYEALGYRCYRMNHHEDQPLATLKPLLTGKTSVFVGQSGVGKSSIIAQLIPNEQIQVGAVSAATGKGRHTTTTTMLYHLPDPLAGQVIDSPGIREFGLWHLSRQMVESGFIEFRAYLGQCKFKDCHHQKEPGCALKLALAEQKVASWRFANYDRLIKDKLT